MTPWIVRGDRVRFANNRRGPLGVVTGLAGDAAWVRWDGSQVDTKVTGLSRLEVLGSARRDRCGNVRGELDEHCLVLPASIGWFTEDREPDDPDEAWAWRMRQMYPEIEEG